jgi:hypothetical protein
MEKIYRKYKTTLRGALMSEQVEKRLDRLVEDSRPVDVATFVRENVERVLLGTNDQGLLTQLYQFDAYARRPEWFESDSARGRARLEVGLLLEQFNLIELFEYSMDRGWISSALRDGMYEVFRTSDYDRRANFAWFCRVSPPAGLVSAVGKLREVWQHLDTFLSL